MRLFFAETDSHKFAIDQEELTEVGRPENTELNFHLYIWDKKSPEQSRDYLENSLELAMEIAEEDFHLKQDAWIAATSA